MAITDLNLLGTGSSKTAATTLAVVNTTGAVIPAGVLIVIVGCWDNVSATAPTITCSTIGGATAVANHATPIGSGATATAGAGIFHQCFRAYTTAAIASGATIATLTSNQSAVARAAHAEGWFGVTGTLRGTVASGTSTTGSPSVATTGTALVAGDLVIGTVSYENNVQMTADADTLNGTWDAVLGTFTTGSTAQTNVGTGTQDKIVTATGAQTFNPTGGVGDTVACVFAVIPVAAGPSVSTVTDTFTTLGAQWSVWGGTGVTASGGRLNVLPTQGNTTYRGMDYVSGQTALRGSQVFMELVDAGNRSLVSWEAYPLGLQVSTGTPNSVVEWYVNQTTLGVLIAGSLVFTMTYDPVAHRFVSIRESGGTVYFETSPTAWPGTWVSRFTRLVTALPTYFDIDNSFIEISAGTYSVEAGTTTAMVLDNLNVIPPVVATLNGKVPTLTGVLGDSSLPIVALLAEYSFDEGTGDTAHDTSGNGYDLWMDSSGIWITGGHTAGGITPSNVWPDRRAFGSGSMASWTVMAWVKPTVVQDGSGYQPMMISSPQVAPECGIHDGHPYVWDGVNVNGDPSTTSPGGVTPQLTTGVWSHLAYVCNAGAVSMYINGSLVFGPYTPVVGTVTFDRADLYYIAGAQGQEDNVFKGNTDDFRIFNSALTGTEVTTYMNTPAGGAPSSTTGTLTGVTPVLTGTVVGTERNPATLSGKVPVLTGTLTGASVNVATLNGKVPVLTGSLPDSSVSVWSGGTPPTGLTAYDDAHPTRIGSTFYLYGGVTGWSTIGMRFYITNELIAGNQIGSDIPVYLYAVPSDGSNPYNGSPLSTATIPFASITVQGWYTAIWPTPVALTNVIPVVVAYQIGSQAYLAAIMTGAAISNAPVALSGSADSNGSYSWFRSYYEYMDILNAGNGTYWTGVDLIVAPVVAGSGGSNNATLNGSVPVLTGSDTGAATNPATLSGKVPVLTGTDTGTVTNAATLNGQVPTLTGSATGTTVNTATLNSAVPVLTGSFTAGNISGGTITGSVPVLTGSVVGTQVNLATLSGSAPVLRGSVSGSAVNTATVSGAVPVLTGSILAGFVVPVTLTGAVPVLTGSATGTSTDLATLSGKVPVLTGSATGAGTNPATLIGKLPLVTGLTLDQTVNVGILNGSTPPLVGGFVGTLTDPGVLVGAVPLLRGTIIDANIVAVNITLDIGPTRSRAQTDIATTRAQWAIDNTRSRSQADVAATRGGTVTVDNTRSRAQADIANTRVSSDVGPTRG